MTDKETLILAAKAIGIQLDFTVRGDFPPYYVNERGGHSSWNPLTSNDDCFRLETARELTIKWWKDCIESHNPEGWTFREFFADHNGDKDKARRYASTRAANHQDELINEVLQDCANIVRTQS